MLKQITLFKSVKRSESLDRRKEISTKKVARKKSMSVINLDCDFDNEEDDGAFLDSLSQKDAILLDMDVQTEPKADSTSNIEESQIKSAYYGVSTSPPSTSALSTSLIQPEAIQGFDEDAGQTWVYPINYPVRDYQFNIVNKALFRNTLVSLPTGLGKTFIASVVMYNMYRWYPSGKVVFMAPTKPLVAQQIEACYKIVGISREAMGEMTGSLSPARRKQIWSTKRVLFLTPQVMQNDLARCAFSAEDIKCVVFDEAHKALGNHSYCQVVRELSNLTTKFRVLALTATPGDDLKAVQQVVTNLMISNIEIRSEDSFDIQPYTNTRKHEKVVIPLEGDIDRLRCEYLKVLEVLMQRLVSQKAMYFVNADRVHKFQLLQARSQFRATPPPTIKSDAQRNQIEGDFALGISLYHAFELLELHGMRNFYHYLKNSVLSPAGGGRMAFRAKIELGKNPALTEILEDLDSYFGAEDTVDGSESLSSRSPRKQSAWKPRVLQPGRYLYSHPKLKKLEEIVLDHFKKWEESMKTTGSIEETRVMIFSQYRESVREITDLLCRHAPLVRVMSFVGHSSSNKSSKGLTQKEQLDVVKKFRQGGYNTLVSTCVGEEGLDIGEVDLIVCFDSSKSPIRLVQRMGRTGRKRDGRVVSLMTKGKEEQAYMKSESNKRHIHKAIVQGCKTLQYYVRSPRMVPRHIQPQLHKLHIKVDEFKRLESKKKTTSSSSIGKSKGRQQLRLSFGLPVAASTHKMLPDDRLVQWKNKYALDEKEASTLTSCVRAVLKPSLLSKSFLGNRATIHSENRELGLNSVMSDHQHLLSSSGEDRPFDIGRWAEWQTAPACTKFVGHSKDTRKFLTVMELTGYAGTNPDMGASYDLEMKTFLNREDVGSPSGFPSPVCEEEEEGVRRMRLHSRRPAFVIGEDEEDEDFEFGGPKAQSKSDAHSDCVENVQSGSTQVDNVPFTDSNTASLESPSNCDVEILPKVVDNVYSSETTDTLSMEQNRVQSPTDVSEDFEVPPPPSFSELEWMEGISSQPCSQLNTPQHTSLPQPSPSSTHISATSTPVAAASSDVHTKCIPATSSMSSRTDAGGFKIPHTPPSSTHKPAVNTSRTSRDIVADVGSNDQATSPCLRRAGVVASSPRAPSLLKPSNISSPSGTCDSEEDSFCLVRTTRLHGKRKLMTIKTLSPCETSSNSSPPAHSTPRHLLQKRTPSIVEGESEFESPLKSKRKRKAHFSSDESLILQEESEGSDEGGEESDESVVDLSEDPEEDWQKCELKTRRKKAKEFIEGEAELSEEDIGKYSSDEPDDLDNYNVVDSFINDATILTQVTPTQRGKKRKGSRPPQNMFDVYRKSLRSPQNNLFSSRAKNHGRFRMVLSQRHGILRKYAKKAGFDVSLGKPNKSRKHVRSNEDTFADSSQSSEMSEAEEVLVPFGEESQEDLGSEVDSDTIMETGRKKNVSTFDEEELYHDVVDELLADEVYGKQEESSGSNQPAQNTTSLQDQPATCNRNSTVAPPSMRSLSSSPVTATATVCSTEPTAVRNPSDPSTLKRSLEGKLTTQEIAVESKSEPLPSFLQDVSPGFKILRPGSTRMMPGSPPVKTSGECTQNLPTTHKKAMQCVVGPGIIKEPPCGEVLESQDMMNYTIGMEEWIRNSDEEDSDAIGHVGTEEWESFIELFDEDPEENEGNMHNEQRFNLEDHVLSNHEPDIATSPFNSQGVGGNDDIVSTPPTTHSDPGQSGIVPSSPVAETTSPHSEQPPPVPSSTSTWPTSTSTTLHRLKQQMMQQDMFSADSELRIFADSREIAKSQIISQLRQKHGVSVDVRQLGVCSFAVSYRMCVERRSVSEFTTHAASTKVADRLKQMSLLYSKRCLIIEKDRVREDKKAWTKPPKVKSYYEQCIAQLMLSDILVLFSEGPDETSKLIVKLAKVEFQKGHRIRHPIPTDSDSVTLLKVLQQIPVVSLPIAVGLCGAFRRLQHLCKCSPQEMCEKLPSLSFSNASKIHQFLHHKFCLDLA